jgi:hypothetical protein
MRRLCSSFRLEGAVKDPRKAVRASSERVYCSTYHFLGSATNAMTSSGDIRKQPGPST